MISRFVVAATLWLALCVPCAVAAGPVLEVPIECDMARDCFIQQYFDHDPAPGYRDYACGTLSYDGHTGTDIRVGGLDRMERGVPVLAAADGTVRAVRDGMDDVSVREAGVDSLGKRFAGNSVAVVHEGGMETQYSHLKKGSVCVRPGQEVRAGQMLGLVGLSGRTEFPHLEFTVRMDGEAVDPFKGLGGGPMCGPGDAPLWSEAALRRMPYEPTRILGAGFASAKPTMEAASRGELDGTTLPAAAPALVFWVRLAGLARGDVLDMELVAPGGTSMTHKSLTLDRSKAQVFRFIGVRRGKLPWPRGQYQGRFVLRRAQGGAAEPVEAYRATRILTIAP